LEQLALGRVGLLLDYYYSLTYRQFMNTVIGFENKRTQNTQMFWEMTRKIMYAAVMPHAKQGLKDTEILEFPWEKEQIRQLSLDEMAAMQEQEALSKAFFDRWDKSEKIKA
jgi:hypothetical protein